MNYRILLIEDNVEMGENISSILELAGYHVIYAQNGRVGINLTQETHPDLILCDIKMPEIDGYKVFHILKSDQKTVNIPFIFLTAKTEYSEFRTGMNLGADDYITKPFDELDLLKVIEIRLKKNEMKKLNSGLQHLKDMENRFLEIVNQSIRQSVADAIMKINDSVPQPIPRSDNIISIRDIFFLVDTSTETLKQTLADFRDEGLIQISGEGLKISNLLKLQKIGK